MLSKSNLNGLGKRKIESAIENKVQINKPIYPWIIAKYYVILETK